MKENKQENSFDSSALNIREKERIRIARDLHDVSLQNLTHLVHKIELSSLYIDKDTVRAKLELETVKQDLRQAIDEIRMVVYNLHPMSLDDLGLKETVERMVELNNKDNHFFVKTDIDNIEIEDKTILLSLFRMIQECYSNAVKHSNGNQIFISFKAEKKKYIINVSDNGKGFDIEKVEKKDNHFGLSIMKERISILNGTINYDSSDKGTSVIIEIPFQ